jgi:hypothetical protein
MECFFNLHISQEHGVILSPRYPDIVIVSCSWRIAVPRDHFAVITVHNLERQVDNCNGGLQIRARQHCSNNSIPPGLICNLKVHVSNGYVGGTVRI